MNINSIFKFFFFQFFIFFHPFLLAKEDKKSCKATHVNCGWKQVHDRRSKRLGVTLYERKWPNQKILALKAEKLVPFPPRKILEVLSVPKHWKHWVEYFKKGHIIQRLNSRKHIIFQYFDLPWPMADRFAVMSIEISIRKNGKEIIMTARSVPHSKAPKVKGIKMNIVYSEYKITEVKKNLSRVATVSLVDPGGLLPTWFVNMIQRSYPRRSFVALEDYLEEVK